MRRTGAVEKYQQISRDTRGDDVQYNAAGEQRFGFTKGDGSTTDDQRSAAFTSKCNGEHGSRMSFRIDTPNTSRHMEKPARAAFVGALIAALITLPGLGVGTLWDNSETAYAEVAREILLTHDWVVMHSNLDPWFVQPPLYFWIAAVFVKVLGLSSFAFRLPAALATIVMGAMTGYAVARQAGTRVGIFASAVLSSCLMQAIIGRLAIMDALLDLAVALTVFFWFRSIEAGRDRYFLYGWVAAALGFLAKGPVAPVVALLVVGVFAWWNRRAEETRLPSWRAWAFGLVLAAAIIAPWLVAIAANSGTGALVQLVGHYTIGRYTGVIENQAGPIWYYVPVVILGFFPWIAFLPMALAYGVRALSSPDTPPNIARLWRLAFAWVVVPLVFFSFARTKLPNYIALEFPALALMTALYFEAVVKKGASRSIVISCIGVSLTMGMCAIALAIFVRDNHLTSSALTILPDLAVMGASIFGGSILSAVLFLRREWVPIAPYGLCIAMLIAVDVLAVVALPHAEPFKPIPFFAATIQAGRKPGDVVAIQSFRGANALLFYTQPRVYVLWPADVKISDEGIDPHPVICSHDRVWLVAPKKRPAVDPLYGRSRKLIEENGSGALFLISGAACTS